MDFAFSQDQEALRELGTRQDARAAEYAEREEKLRRDIAAVRARYP